MYKNLKKAVLGINIFFIIFCCFGCNKKQVENSGNKITFNKTENLNRPVMQDNLDIIYKFDSTKNSNSIYDIDDFYMDYVDEKIYNVNDGKLDKVSDASFEIENYVNNHCEKSNDIVNLKNKLLSDKNVKKVRTYNDVLVVAKQDNNYNNDKIEFYNNKLNLVNEIKGYCYFVIYEEENVLIIKHRYNNIDLYRDNSGEIEYLWYKEEVLYGYNIVDNNLKTLFDVPVSNVYCRYSKENSKQIDNLVLCNDFYKSYIYDMKKREIVEKLDGVDYKNTFLNDIFAMMVDSIDVKVGKIKIIISNGKFHTINENYNKIQTFNENMISFINKNYDYLSEVILVEDKNNKFFVYDENLKEEKDRYLYWTYDGKKIVDGDETIKILEYGYYVKNYEKYDVEAKQDGESIKLELNNVDKSKNKIINIELLKDEKFNIKKFRINRFFDKDYYFIQKNQFFSEYYNLYDMNSKLILKDIRYREIYKEDKSKNFENGLLVLESGEEKEDNTMSGILYYFDKDFKEIKEKTNYTTSLSNTRIVKIGDISFLLFTSKGMEHLMSFATLKEFKYDKYTNFNSIYYTGNSFEIVWNSKKKFVVDANLDIVSTEEIKK